MERDGVHARRLEDVERALKKDSRLLVVLALGLNWGGKKDCECMEKVCGCKH